MASNDDTELDQLFGEPVNPGMEQMEIEEPGGSPEEKGKWPSWRFVLLGVGLLVLMFFVMCWGVWWYCETKASDRCCSAVETIDVTKIPEGTEISD